MKKQIYLDYNASCPMRPDARSALMAALGEGNAALNASAVHAYGREGRKIIEQSRTQIAQAVNIPPAQIIFNSGATEGNNTVLRHFKTRFPHDHIAISSTEHPSVSDVFSDTLKIPVDGNGLVQPQILDAFLSAHKPISLVSIILAHNETGVIQDVAELSSIAHKHGALLHCDGVQAFGRIPIDMAAMGIDFLTLSAHKIGGMQGVGALALGLCGQTPVLLLGGGQEKSARAGTENIAGIAAFGAASSAAQAEMEEYTRKTTSLRDMLESRLTALSGDVVIHAQHARRLPNTSFFSLRGGNAQTMLMALDLEGIAVSNGSACSSGTVKPSKTLAAMGAGADLTSSALRVSMGWATTEGDILAFISAFEKILQRHHRNS